MLKGRKGSPDALDDIQDVLLMKHLNLTPVELKRLPYEEKLKYTIILNEIIATSPSLIGISATNM